MWWQRGVARVLCVSSQPRIKQKKLQSFPFFLNTVPPQAVKNTYVHTSYAL